MMAGLFCMRPSMAAAAPRPMSICREEGSRGAMTPQRQLMPGASVDLCMLRGGGGRAGVWLGGLRRG